MTESIDSIDPIKTAWSNTCKHILEASRKWEWDSPPMMLWSQIDTDMDYDDDMNTIGVNVSISVNQFKRINRLLCEGGIHPGDVLEAMNEALTPAIYDEFAKDYPSLNGIILITEAWMVESQDINLTDEDGKAIRASQHKNRLEIRSLIGATIAGDYVSFDLIRKSDEIVEREGDHSYGRLPQSLRKLVAAIPIQVPTEKK